jgi:hypothetical protein
MPDDAVMSLNITTGIVEFEAALTSGKSTSVATTV